MKGGTIMFERGGLHGINSEGESDLAVLKLLKIKYVPIDTTPHRIPLLDFYEYPDRVVSGFDKSFDTAFGELNPREKTKVIDQLDVSIKNRFRTCIDTFTIQQYDKAQSNHIHMLAVTISIRNRFIGMPNSLDYIESELKNLFNDVIRDEDIHARRRSLAILSKRGDLTYIDNEITSYSHSLRQQIESAPTAEQLAEARDRNARARADARVRAERDRQQGIQQAYAEREAIGRPPPIVLQEYLASSAAARDRRPEPRHTFVQPKKRDGGKSKRRKSKRSTRRV
jgi:hypothetical protein